MTPTKKQERAQAAIKKLRGKRIKFREIEAATGVSKGYLSDILRGNADFSDEIADKVIAGCKGVKL